MCGWHRACIVVLVTTMAPTAHEIVLDLERPVAADDGRLYRASVVGRTAADGHWNAWLEFVALDSHEVLRTGIETHQASDADLHHWAMTLGDVYLDGALDRALVSPADTAAHRHAMAQAAAGRGHRAPADLDLFGLFALGEHALRRELQLFTRATLRALIINYDLNPTPVDLSAFTKDQLVAFIVTAIDARDHMRPRG